MDNKPSLSQYFADSEAPPASQFFDEIGTSPSDMIQSVYLGDNEGKILCKISLYKSLNCDVLHLKSKENDL